MFNPVEFRLYFTDTSDSSSDILRLDDLVFLGYATNLPPGVQLVTISAADAAARESGSDSGLFRFQRFGETTGSVTVNYTVGGTASNGVDYTALTGAVVFGPGETNVLVPVVPLDDVRPELEENIVVTLVSNAAYNIVGTGNATIRLADDNDPPEFVVSATVALAYEGTPSLSGVFTVARPLGDTNSQVDVGLAFGGTATFGVDYFTSETNFIRLNSGETAKTITITPINDSVELF